MIKRCVVCGAEFEAGDRSVACSEKCRRSRKRNQWREFYLHNRELLATSKRANRLVAKSEALVRRVCVVCGEEITSLRNNRATCSPGCKREARNAAARRRTVGVTRRCVVCRIMFRVTSSDVACSPECRASRSASLRDARRPAERARDRDRYQRDAEKRRVRARDRGAERSAAIRLIRELQAKGIEALL